MDWITILNGAFGAGVILTVGKLIDAYLSRNKSKAETGKIKSESTENITEAAQVAANILLQALNFKKTEVQDLQADVKALQENQKASDQLIIELTNRKEERDEQIQELQEQNEALHIKLAAMQTQIEKDTNETEALRKRIVEIEEKYNRMKRVNEKLVKALVDAKVPMPDMNGDLTDSVKGLKWQK